MRRRRFLASLVVGCGSLVLSGCTESQSVGEFDDIHVRNETEHSQTVTVQITQASTQEILLDETITLTAEDTGSDDSVSFSDPITSSGDHRVNVTVEDGPTDTYTWDVPGSETTQDEAHVLSIDIHSTRIGFTHSAG